MSTPAKIQRIAVLTSGGDAPGMNAALRAVVLAGEHYGLEVFAFKHGYQGLLDNDHIRLCGADVLHILQYSGTIIKSARCKRFVDADAAELAAKNLDALDIDALIIIGGDGSFRGAEHLAQFWNGQIIGVPGTIDNDLYGTDATIGYATAVAIAMDALDKIRDTADAMDRVFIVEVMGRNAGFIGLSSAMAAGSERMILPELQNDKPLTVAALVKHIERVQKIRGDGSYVMVLSEHQWPGGAVALAEQLEAEYHLPCRPCLLGHIQRGGPPAPADRILASELGVHAVELALDGQTRVMAGIKNHAPVAVPLADTWQKKNPLNKNLLRIQHEIFNPVKKNGNGQ
ncbi:6-phosphofructokinase [Pseudidiomarina salinarum]|uniref:6-phosphofructokinase n=1 Tax=Pseudidiomarina salinarum TaxID=435908 RepID=A0A094IWH9_9GAMM|nr:ATP-dependent 6-phosphofructokinase [Pseudidiomarina salinarum]KFZ30184.1 6-phosphofructokinase [Pseudidiomarina salinarum]RUO68685.1 ATP-dependent 6-phosphofructokinase [Pseudidiomarina salinarum]